MALEADRQCFGIVAAAAADFAHHINIGQKIHFDAAQAVALACFAAAALYVEAEAAGAIAAFARFGKHGEELADRCENAGVGGGVRAWRAADRRLIDLDHFVDVLRAEKLSVSAGRIHGAVELLRQGSIQDVIDESGLAGARDTGNHGQQAEGQSDVDVLEVVGVRANDLDGLCRWGCGDVRERECEPRR